MKALLRSIVVLALVLVTTGTATLAYFTSNVSATGNLITTGTLRLAIDSTALGSGNSGYVVAYDNGTTQLLAPFPTISNIQPGETRSVYVTMRNLGSLAFDYRANFTGSWTSNPALDANVISVSNVRRFPTGNCFADAECEDIYFWLTGIPPFTHTGVDTTFGSLSTAANSLFFGHADALSDGVNTLLPNEFAIFQVDFTMWPGADNSFQGQTFTYSMNAQAKQTTAPTF